MGSSLRGEDGLSEFGAVDSPRTGKNLGPLPRQAARRCHSGRFKSASSDGTSSLLETTSQ